MEEITTSKGFADMNDGQHMKLTRVSSLEEYHAAGPGVQNRAGKFIDEGFEGYLLNMDLYDMSMHPFIPIHDLTIKKNDKGLIGVVTSGGQNWLPGDTLIVWR